MDKVENLYFVELSRLHIGFVLYYCNSFFFFFFCIWTLDCFVIFLFGLVCIYNLDGYVLRS
ncbi:hypothetical protein CsatB_014536 [Cannabis sativa]